MLSPCIGARARCRCWRASRSLWPSTTNGASSARWIFQAIAAAPARSVPPSGRIPNSSPPRRATVSPSRRHSTSRSATSLSSTSPCWWPSVSLTCLNSSRSSSSSASGCLGPQRDADRVAHAVLEEHPVGQVGQVVVQRLVLQRLGVALALGDVAQAGDVDLARRPAARRSGRSPSGRSCRPCAARDSLGRPRGCLAGSGAPARGRRSRRFLGASISENGWPTASSSRVAEQLGRRRG